MTRYLITGGAGFVASHLLEQLAKDKKNYLRILVAPWDSMENLESLRADIVIADLRNKKDLVNITKDIDIVFHLAALTMRPYYGKEDYFRTNIDGTENLLKETIKNKVKKFVFFSSIAVFGLPAYIGNMKSFNEDSGFKFKEVYGESKYKAEKLVEKYSRKYKLPYIIIRPTTVYGPRDHQNMLELFKVINKGLYFPIGNGKNKMDYVFVGDLVTGAIKAANSKIKNEDYILGGGRVLTQKRLISLVAKAINKKIPVLRIPYFISLPLSWLIDKTFGIFGKRAPIFPDRVKVLTRDCYFSIDKAKVGFGYNPKTSFEDGMKITADWLKESKVI